MPGVLRFFFITGAHWRLLIACARAADGNAINIPVDLTPAKETPMARVFLSASIAILSLTFLLFLPASDRVTLFEWFLIASLFVFCVVLLVLR